MLEALVWTQRLLALALVQKNTEMFFLAREGLIYPWSILRNRSGYRYLGLALGDRSYASFCALNIFLSLVYFVFPHPFLSFVLLLFTLFHALRWQGNFNGGADAMLMVLLVSVNLAGWSPRLGLAYIAAQLTLSYFTAGLAKVRHGSWLRGEALTKIFLESAYALPPAARSWAKNVKLMRLSSWLLLLFELSFPVVFVGSRVCFVYLGLATIFHLANFYLFGLNRFFLVWMATYPALYFCVAQ